MKTLLMIMLAIVVSGCSQPPTEVSNGGTFITDGNGSCTVYIIEKDGHKFAVAVGMDKCGITQVRE